MSFLTDTFSGTAGTNLSSHTSDSGATWSIVPASGTESFQLNGSNGITPTASTGAQYQSSASLPAGSYVVQVDLQLTAAPSATGMPGLILTNGTNNQGYRLIPYGGTLYLQTIDGGTTIQSATDTLSSGNTYTYSLEYNPTTQTLTGKNVTTSVTLSGVNSTFTPTAVGVSDFGGSTSANWILENLSASALIPPLTAGATFASPASSTSNNVTCGVATGGTGPYTYQFQRAPDVSGSPGSYSNIGTSSSATSLLDTGLSASTAYWYRNTATDSTTATNTSSGFKITTSTPTATGNVEYIMNSTTAVASDAGSGGNGIANLYDNDFTTYYYSVGASNAWCGIDLQSGNTGVVTSVLMAPANFFGNDALILGGTVDGATTTSGPWSKSGSVGTTYLGCNNFNTLTVSPAGGWQCFRIAPPSTVNCAIGELRFQGWWVSGLTWQPGRPVFSPGAGRLANGSTVTITSPTTDATLYYTVDGTTPTITGGVPQGTTTLYSGPVTLPSNQMTQLQAIAYHASGTTKSSAVTSGMFLCPAAFVPDTGTTPNYGTSNHWSQDWYDDSGVLIEAHYGGVFYDNATSKYWWAGIFFNTPTSSDVNYRGFWFYSSNDLYNWHNEGMLLAPPPNTTTFQDGSGNYLDSQTRPHILVNPSPSNGNHKYVLYVHLDTVASGYEKGHAGVATSPNINGPWTWQTAFQSRNSSGTTVQVKDCSLFLDTNGNAYLIHNAALVSTPFTTVVQAIQLDPTNDWMSLTGNGITLDSSNTREAPVVWQYNGQYFLIDSTGTPYGGTITDLQYYSATTLAGLGSASAASPFTVAPTTGSISNNVQATAIFAVQGRKGFILQLDLGDPGESPLTLYHSRHTWWPLPPSAFPTSSTISMGTPASWTINGSLPGSGGVWPFIDNGMAGGFAAMGMGAM